MLHPIHLTQTQLDTMRQVLSSTYLNSRALHEKRVHIHSKTWRKDIETMRRMWGVDSPVPKFLVEHHPRSTEIQNIMKRQGWDISKRDTNIHLVSDTTTMYTKVFIADEEGDWHECDPWDDITM